MVSRSESGLDWGLALVFFITASLASGGESCADEARPWGPLRESYNEEAVFVRQAEHEIALLLAGVIGVGKQKRQWVTKRRDGFFEVDAVLAEVGRRLVRVPLELIGHARNLAGGGGECA
jgi:hypothetical protein